MYIWICKLRTPCSSLVFACLRNSNWLEVDCLQVSLTSVVTVKVCCWVYCIDSLSCMDCFNKPSLRRCLGYPQTDWEFTSKLKRTAMLSIQRSCGEIPELFTQISIMAAGTGSTALFTVICSLLQGVYPFAQTSSSTLDLVSVCSYCFGLWIDSGGDYFVHTSSMGKTTLNPKY